MQFKFRILDLIALTLAVALLFGAFRQDLAFFRQLLCLELAALFSTVGVMLFSNRKKPAWLAGAIFGCLAGLVFVVATYVLVGQVYEQTYRLHQSLVQDPIYLIWFEESGVSILVSIVFGSAIGPLMLLRLGGLNLPSTYARSFRISVGILLAMLLIAVLRMFDQLVSFGQSRDLTPLLIVALAVFVVYTNQWLVRYYRDFNNEAAVSETGLSKRSPVDSTAETSL